MLIGALPVAAAVAAIVWSAGASGPAGPEERFRTALSALERGDLDTVATTAAALEDQPGYAVHVRVLDAALLLRSGHPDRALAELAALELEGDVRPPGMLVLGESLYRLRRLAEAEIVFRQLVEVQPDRADVHRWLGAIYFDLGANTAAIAALTRVTELDPNDYAPHRLIGLMHYDFEQYSEAIQHYRRALELRPPPAIRDEILRELAKSLIAERQYAEALEALESARVDGTVLALRAECFWSLGRQEEARETLQQARTRDPDERFAALLESRIRMEDGQPDEAIKVLEHVLRDRPHDAECRYQLALACRQLGDQKRYEAEMARFEESAGLHRKLTELNVQAIEQPRNAEVRDQVADLCLKLGKDELAAVWRAAARACRETQAARPSALNSLTPESGDHDGT